MMSFAGAVDWVYAAFEQYLTLPGAVSPRLPDRYGLSAYGTALMDGAPEEDLRVSIRTSRERVDWVHRLFLDELHRAASEEEAVAWATPDRTMTEILLALRNDPAWAEANPAPEPEPEPGIGTWVEVGSLDLAEGSAFGGAIPLPGAEGVVLVGLKDEPAGRNAVEVTLSPFSARAVKLPGEVDESIAQMVVHPDGVLAATEHQGAMLRREPDGSWVVEWLPDKAHLGDHAAPTSAAVSLGLDYRPEWHSDPWACCTYTAEGGKATTLLLQRHIGADWKLHHVIRDFISTSLRIFPDGVLLGGGKSWHGPAQAHWRSWGGENIRYDSPATGDPHEDYLWRSCWHEGTLYLATRPAGRIYTFVPGDGLRLHLTLDSWADRLLSWGGHLWTTCQDGYVRHWDPSDPYGTMMAEKIGQKHPRAIVEAGGTLWTFASDDGQKNLKVWRRS